MDESTHRGLRPAPTVAVSYRLPPDVADLIDAAVDHAAMTGDRLSKNEAVVKAIRATYGHLQSSRRAR